MAGTTKSSNTKAIVMLSGGLDSAVSLFWAKTKHWQIQALSFNYYERSRRELKSARKLSDLVRCPMRIIGASFLKEIDDLRKNIENKLLFNAPSAYIPSRNTIFYGIASSIAEVTNCRYIVAGHNADDARSFPDASPRFFAAFNKATEIGQFSRAATGRIVMPLANLTKPQVILLGEKLGVPFELTWSCYKSGKGPCGKCSSCKLRATAFRRAGLRDPLLSKRE